jgi:alpha,alpha-trehalase
VGMQRKSSAFALRALALLLVACACVHCAAQCTSPIYCNGPILDAVARAGILVNNSGDFVDMPSRFPPQVVLENFRKLPTNATYNDLQLFLDSNFFPPGSDLVNVVAPDWTPDPPFLKLLNDSNLAQFGSDINQIWNHLIRKWNNTMTCEGCYSHIDVPYPFSIAGSSF